VGEFVSNSVGQQHMGVSSVLPRSQGDHAVSLTRGTGPQDAPIVILRTDVGSESIDQGDVKVSTPAIPGTKPT
jgi:hypothetical protein